MDFGFFERAKRITNWIRDTFTLNMNITRSYRGRWQNLPDVVLTDVFKYLSDHDKLNAALVCFDWYKVFESPCLWRRRHFDMGGFRAQVNGYRACKFAERFGQYLRYLSMSCSHPSFHTCKQFQSTIEELFGRFKDEETQLHEFEFCRLELERYWKYDTPREKVIGIFSKFFKTQKAMRCFDMSYSQFPTYGGCRILDSIGYQSGDTITDLILEDFFHSRLAVYQAKKYRKCISRFINIKYLALNYNCISEEVIEIFSKTLARKLEFLNVKIFRNDPHFHRISGYSWKMLRRACPKLKISFWFESIGSFSEISPVLVNEAPVKDIHIWTGYDEDNNWRLGQTVDLISEVYYGTLESLSLELDNNHEIVDHEIINLVMNCKKLRELSINAIISIATVEMLCELQREHKIDLRLLHLTCCGLSEPDWVELIQIRHRYQPMIVERNICFKITTDLIVEPDML